MAIEIDKQQIVIIPFEHLNPNLQSIVTSIHEIRKRRIITDSSVPITSLLATIPLSEGSIKRYLTILGLSNIALITRLILHPSRAKVIQIFQKFHDALKDSAKTHGILQTQYEHQYPNGWINPEVVARTHPIFNITINGDIVFRQVNRREYLQWMLQKGTIGKYGINPWFWRGYLEDPKASESIKDWANRRYKEIVEKIKEEIPSPEPIPEPTFGRIKRDEIETRKLRERQEF